MTRSSLSFISTPVTAVSPSLARLFAVPVTSRRRPRVQASYDRPSLRRSSRAPLKSAPDAAFRSELDEPTSSDSIPSLSSTSTSSTSSTSSRETDKSKLSNVSEPHSEPVSGNGVAAKAANNPTPKDKSATGKRPPAPSSKVNVSIGPFKISVASRSLLYTVPFLWGSFAPAVRFLFAQNPHQDPSVFNSERLLLSTLVYAPVLLPELRAFWERRAHDSKDETPKSVNCDGRFDFFPAGFELGVYVFLANIAQVLGLEQTSASRAAFLVQLQTVFVPILGTVLGVDNISFTNGLSSLIAVAGVFLLSADKTHGAVSSFTGDALEVVSAIFFTAYIVRLGAFCNKVSPTKLVATKIATQAILSILWAVSAESLMAIRHVPHTVISDGTTIAAAPWTLPAVAVGMAVVLWTGLFPSAIAGWAQTKGQQGVKPSEAVLIYATQPLWSTGLAAVLLGESFGIKGLFGGGLIVLSSLLPSLLSAIPFFQRLDKEQASKDD